MIGSALLQQLSRNLEHLVVSVISGGKQVAISSSKFIRDTFRAHYNLIGRYTAPIETELLGTTPPNPKNLNFLGQFALTIVPLTILSWLIALTIGPLVYNSLRSLKLAFLNTTNLSLLDLPSNEQIGASEEELGEFRKTPWYRLIYGIPGLILGVVLGLISATGVILARMPLNSIKSFFYSFIYTTDLALEDEDSIENTRFFVKDNRNPWQINALGLFGVLAGTGIGFGGFVAVVIGRAVLNSYDNIKKLSISGINLVREEQIDDAFKFDAKPSILRKYFLGLPGIIFGLLISAPLGLVAGVVERAVKESYKTAKILFDKLTQKAFALGKKQEELSLDQSEVEQDSKEGDFSVFGVPGFLVGAVLGSLSFFAILSGRVIYNSFISATGTFIDVFNLALHPTMRLGRLDDTSRSEAEILGFGLLGLGFGAVLGAVGSTLVGLARVINNSLKTTVSLSASAVNWVIHDDEQLKIALKDETREDYEIWGLGFLGLIFGPIGAGVGVSFALARRIIIESYKSTKETYEAIIHEAKLILEDPVEEFLIPTEIDNQNKIVERSMSKEVKKERLFLDKVLGSPGLLLGFLGGLTNSLSVFTLHILKESYKSAIYGFATVTNLGLYSAHRIGPQQDNRLSKQKYFGLVGGAIGGLAGVLGFIIYGFARNSFETSKRLIVSSLNTVREQKNTEEDWAHDPRHGFLKFILGFPGLIIGLPVGVIIQARLQIWLTTQEFFNAMVTPVLPGKDSESSEELAKSAFAENRTIYQRFILGGPGVFLGIPSGFIAFISIIALRSLVNSAKSFIPSFAYVTNWALDSKQQIENTIEKDSRHEPIKFGFGFFGVVSGGALGLLFGFTAVALYRIVKESLENMRRLTITGINLATYKEEQLEEAFDFSTNDYKHKLILGSPGLFLGIFTLLIGTVGAGFLRSVKESMRTAKIVYSQIADQAREKEEFVIGEQENFNLTDEADDGEQFAEEGYSFESVKPKPKQEKTFADYYFFGVPGILPGAIAGIFGFIVIGSSRVWKESVLSAKSIFWAAIKKALDESNEIKIAEPPRSRKLQYGFGLPGFALGLFAGGLGYIIVLSARIFKHSAITIRRLTASALNLIRYDQIDKVTLQDDNRNDSRKRLGAPGYVVGSFVALFALAYAVIERAIIESIKTTVELFVEITARAFSTDLMFRYIMPKFEQRFRIDQGLFGAIGVPYGLLVGALGFLAVGISRAILNSIDLGRQTFALVANLGLDEDDTPYSFKEFMHDDAQSKEAKHILASPGIAIGFLLGSIVLAGIGIVKWSTHSLISWRSLSGSIVNGSRELPLFEGMRGDKRTGGQKAFGGLGYLAALVTTFPPLALYFTLKKLVLISALALGIICSPIIALIKGAKLAIRTPRFEGKVNENQTVQSVNDTEQRFKNIYSSLSALGELNENEGIKKKQNGGKGPYSFIRKAITFDADYTITENILEELLTGWRHSKNQAEFFSVDGEFEACLSKVKHQYRELSCLEHNELETKPREKHIDEIGAFVKDYILSKQDNIIVPKGLYSNYQQSWSAVFWGAEKAASNQAEVLDNSNDSVAKMV